MNFVEKFISHCEKSPDYIAIVDKDGSRNTTFGDLYIICKKIAQKLISLGVKKNDNVIIALPKSMEYMASIYGILFAGCCFIPLSNDYPVERKNAIISQANVKVIIENNFFDDLDKYEMIDSLRTTLDQNTTITYTSGSEGEPKGVICDLKYIDLSIYRLYDYFKKYNIKSQLFISPLYFVAYMLTLVQFYFDEPTTLHLISDSKSKDIGFINDYLDKYKIEMIFILPRLLKFITKGNYLKVVAVGGEKTTNVFSDRFKVISLYCQTEGIQVGFAFDKPYETSPIGKPLYGITIKIMDDNGCELKKGEIGEICGIGIFANGYFKDEEKTKRVFEKLDDGKVLLHTGDMGYIDEDGILYYVDRKDNMLKLDGKRTDPGEIENVIKKIDFIDECVVKNLKNDNVNILCAFYTTKNGVKVSSNKIIEFIWNKLPIYMIPNRFIYCDSFPCNNNGKIDRKKLNIDSDLFLNREIEAPESEMEKIIADAFSKTLGVSPISRNDDFFQLGGSSVLVMKLVIILEDYDITVQDIYANRTPSKIAKYCNKYDKRILDKENEEALKHDQKLTPINEKFWLYGHFKNINRINGSVIPVIIEIKKGAIDLKKLSDSVYQVFKSHPSILSMIVKDDEGYKLRYKPDILQKIEIQNAKEEELDTIIDSFMKIGDQENGATYKCKLISTEKSDYFVFTQLHALADDYTFLLIIKQIVENYLYGTIPKNDYFYLYLQKIHDMYIDPNNKETLKQIRDVFYADEYDENIAFDKNGLSENSSIKNICYIGQSQLAMELYAKNMGISVSTIYIAAFLKSMSEYNSNKKVKCRWIYNGRNNKYRNDIAGCMISEFPLKIDFDKIHSNKELLEEIERQNKLSFAKSDLISTFDFERSASLIDYLKINDENNDLSKIFKVRNDFFTKRMCVDLFCMVMFITEYEDKNNEVGILVAAGDRYYYKESIDKFMNIYKKNLYEILEI